MTGTTKAAVDSTTLHVAGPDMVLVVVMFYWSDRWCHPEGTDIRCAHAQCYPCVQVVGWGEAVRVKWGGVELLVHELEQTRKLFSEVPWKENNTE